MTDIVVCVPQTREGKGSFYSKTIYLSTAFWTMGRTPKNLQVHDWVWFVNDGKVEFGAEVKTISKGPLPPYESADGYNPPVSKNGCRLTFYDSLGAHVWTHPNDKTYFPSIPCKGFRGFRYKWWKWPDEEDSELS